MSRLIILIGLMGMSGILLASCNRSLKPANTIPMETAPTPTPNKLETHPTQRQTPSGSYRFSLSTEQTEMSVLGPALCTFRISASFPMAQFSRGVSIKLAYPSHGSLESGRRSLHGKLYRLNIFGDFEFISGCCLETDKGEYAKEMVIDLSKIVWKRENESILPSHPLYELISDGEYQLYFQITNEKNKLVRSNVINISVMDKVMRVQKQQN